MKCESDWHQAYKSELFENIQTWQVLIINNINIWLLDKHVLKYDFFNIINNQRQYTSLYMNKYLAIKYSSKVWYSYISVESETLKMYVA